MKKITLLFLLMSAFTQAQRFDWVSTAGYSGIANSIEGAIAIARDSQGNLYTLNSANGQQICQGVTADPFLGGTTTFLYKFNASGEIQYIKPIGENFNPLNIQIGENDNLYLLGSLMGGSSLKIGTETFVEAENRNYIIKFDPVGNLIWRAKNNISFGNFPGSPMLLFSNNHIYFQTGNLSISKLNTSGQFVATLTADSFIPATSAFGVFFKGSGVLANGDLVFSALSRGTITYGTTTLIPTSNLTSSYLTIRTSENLSLIWATYTDGLRDPDQNHIPITVGNDSGIYIGVQVVTSLTAGSDTLNNTGDGASGIGLGGILKMDADGNKIWLKSTTNSAHTWNMLNNPDGSGIFCAGQIFGFQPVSLGTSSVNPTNGNSFVTKIDYNGVFQNSFAFASGPGSYAKSLATNNAGVFYVGGILTSVTTPTFSCITREARAGLYLAKFTEQPDKAPTPIISVAGNTLTASPVFSGTIQWFLNGSAISGANAPTFSATQNGNYSVSYSFVEVPACVSNSVTFNLTSLGIDEYASNIFSVYPNPTKGILIFNFENVLKHINLQIIDISGRIVFKEVNLSANKTIDISSLQSGMYIVKVNQDGKTFSQKIIKE